MLTWREVANAVKVKYRDRCKCVVGPKRLATLPERGNGLTTVPLLRPKKQTND